MARVSGTMPSLSRGVSQQPNDQRVDGQVGEQVNMWSDPVHGLTRRRGSRSVATSDAFSTSVSYWSPTISDGQRMLMDDYYSGYRSLNFVLRGERYRVMYPTRAVPTSVAGQVHKGVVVVKDEPRPATVREDDWSGASFPHVNRPSGAGGSALTTKESKGFSAATQLGDYVFLWPNDTLFSVPPGEDIVGQPANRIGEVTIHVGATARNYTVRLGIDGVTHSFSYSTPPSSYQGTLDTSDIVPGDYSDAGSVNEYQKLLNDRVNAYNSEVTKWISTSALQSTPAYIANYLIEAMRGMHGFDDITSAVSVDLNGPHILIRQLAGHTVYNIETIDDGASAQSTLLSSTWMRVQEQSQLPTFFADGGIVEVRPAAGTDSYYMQATIIGGGGFGPVEWHEVGGFVIPGKINNPMVVLGRASNGELYLRATVDDLRTAHVSFSDLPDFGNRVAGDGDTNPLPSFFNRQVDYMGYFQDRMVIASGNHVCMSRVGGYFEFFRTTVLTLPDTDPVDMFAVGSEDDTITAGVIFDKSLLLFGQRQQYTVDGRVPVTPRTSSIIQSGAIEDATDCQPISGAGSVFFTRKREGNSAVFQLDIGDVADSSRYEELGLQLSDYIRGAPTQLLYVASPNLLVFNTTGALGTMYIYRFIDQGNERILSSWSRFDYGKAMGHIIGMWLHEDNLYYLTLKHGMPKSDGTVTDYNGGYGWPVIEKQSLLMQPSDYPYLDSQQPLDILVAYPAGRYFNMPPGEEWGTAWAVSKVQAYNDGNPKVNSPWWLRGGRDVPPDNSGSSVWLAVQEALPGVRSSHLVVGREYDAFVELTSPSIKDKSGVSMSTGRLTINSLEVYYKDSSGFSAVVKSRFGLADQFNGYEWSAKNTQYGVVTSLAFNGRRLDVLPNMINITPITTGSARVFVGRAAPDYVCELHSNDWLPLSINRVDWHGQFFMNHRRV